MTSLIFTIVAVLMYFTGERLWLSGAERESLTMERAGCGMVSAAYVLLLVALMTVNAW